MAPPLGTGLFKVTNNGSGTANEDFKVCASNKGGRANFCDGVSTAPIVPNHSASLRVTFTKKGVYEYLCPCESLYHGPYGPAKGLRGDLKVG